MKQVKTWINLVLGSMIAALGLNSCAKPIVKYGTPAEMYGVPTIDTTVKCMYGVPAPEPRIIEEEQQSNDK